jgi:hypothetical protein
MPWHLLLEFFKKNKHQIFNTGGVIISMLGLYFLNNRLKKEFPDTYLKFVKYIYFMNVLLVFATTYSIYEFNVSKLLEQELSYLLSLITGEFAKEKEKGKRIKTFIETKNLDRRLQLEADVVELQALLQEETSLWAKRKIDLAKLEDSVTKSQLNDSFEGRIDRMKKKLKALKKLQRAYSKKGLEGSEPNNLGINMYLIFALFTLLLSIQNPNIKILTLMEKILNYFSGPSGPNDYNN